jgi:DNA polymerase V
MIDQLALDLVKRETKTKELSYWVSFDPISIEEVPSYSGPVTYDYYGRLHPKHVVGTVRLRTHTSSTKEIMSAILTAFDAKIDHRLYIRRLGVAAGKLQAGVVQLDLFTDYGALEVRREKEEKELEREKRMQRATLELRKKFGKNAVLKGTDLQEGANTIERNKQIGGHRA